VQFRILGPLEVLDNGREVSIRGRKLQSLLALLLLHSGKVVSRDRLIDGLWGDDPPSTAAKTLQVHVSRLRHELGDVVVSKSGGYLVRVEPDQLDLERFERLVVEGRSALAEHQPERASERLGEALALWRGPALPELADEPFARAQIGRLEDARLAATEEWIEADLELGRHAGAIQQLEPLVASHPYRERLHELLMLALYRSGRQADALEVYREARRVLVDELGLEPGTRLRELHAAILAQDPALEGAAAPRPAPRRASGAQSRRRLWPLVGGAAGALVAVVLVLLGAGQDAAEPSRPLSDDSHAVAVIDPATNQVTTAASVGTSPGPLAFEPESGSLWVGNVDDESVTRVDLDPVRTSKTISIGERPSGLAASYGAVWVTTASRASPYATARRIDARFDTAARPVRVESLPRETRASVALGAGSLWVAPSLGRLTRLDPATGRVSGPSIDAGPTPSAIATGAGAVWVGDSHAGVVSRVDPRTEIAESIPVAGNPTDIAVSSGAVWVTLALDDEVARIDPEHGSVRSTTPVGRRPAGIAVGAGAVWVANSGDGTVSRLDPESGRVTDTIPVGASPQDVIVARERVWVSVRPRTEDATGVPGGTVRVETAGEIDYLDPALAYSIYSWNILHATCASLLTYPSAPGPAATRPVPELAEALPRPSDGGRTYTFTIRRGFRFAPSGEPVTARTMKYTIERTMHPRMKSGGAAHLQDLVGGKAYAEGRASHISGVTASGDTLTLRLTGPASNLPQRIALPFFCAVPHGTPIDPGGLLKVPSAGPYYVATHVPGQEVVLRRNAHYEGPRLRRPDELRITVNAGQAESVARVKADAVDYTSIGASPSTARRLQARYGAGSPSAKTGTQRYFVNAMDELDYLVFNTSRPPFSSVRLRRAVNYALDRRALARQGMWSGLPARPTDQYLPPTTPGFRDVPIYPLQPDVAQARRLAGQQRRTVVLYTQGGPEHVRYAEIVRANLRAIGMDVQIKNLGESFWARIPRRDEPFDMALITWAADYPSPIDFLRQLDGRTIRADGNSNFAYFDDPGFNRRLDAAARLSSPARELALGRLDVQVARTAAPWAALASNRRHDFFSARVGCQRYNALAGLDLGSICTRLTE
jgi:YVTN family beta-propeller protein